MGILKSWQVWKYTSRVTLHDPTGETGKTTTCMHRIELKKEIPVKEPSRRISLYKRQPIDDVIEKLKDKKLIIEKSNSPWSSSLVLVQKKDLFGRLL